jgi:histidine ammonia-lyase
MIVIGDKPLELNDFRKIISEGTKVELSADALKIAEDSYKFLKEFSRNSIIYGINTGFGPMAQYRISDEEQLQLQYNLIRSHCSGASHALSDDNVRALMVCRLTSLMKGNSGVHPDLLILLKELINHEIYPEIFEHGGVGASGDLVQLAHLGLALVGEGNARYKGQLRPVADIYQETGLSAFKIQLREGLGVMNGTSAMTGIGICNLLSSYKLLNWSVIASCFINEIVESYGDHFSAELNRVKLHEGQQAIAGTMRKILTGSKLIRRRDDHLYNRDIKDDVFSDKVQEYYSLRCVPQILGPVLDTLKYAEKVLMNEVNSANDNPIIDLETKNIYHGGNFHGDYISFEMDKVKIAVTKLSMLAERQINFLMNRNLNGKLPPFVNHGKLGFNFGMQGVQFTAVSSVAENQTYSFPMYVHSIPNNNDNQDIVSMGTNAAILTKKVIENSFDVVAIEFMSLLQAVDYLSYKDRLSTETLKIYNQLRQIFPVFVDDVVKFPKIQEVKSFITKSDIDYL